MRSAIFMVLGLIVMPSAALAVGPPIDSILIPVIASHATDSAGARWTSRVSFVYVGQPTGSIDGEPFFPSRAIQPGDRGVLDIREGQTSPGVIAVTTPFRAAELQMTSYVYNEAKPEVGVVLPAVPLSDIVPGQPVHLVGVPITTHSRTLLRIYAMSSSDTDVLVRVFDAKGAVLAADSIHLFGAPVPANGALALRPAYAEYRLTVDPAAHTSTSIDVEPLAPDASVSSMIWAFATTTGAGSESVTAVFPAR